MSPPWNKPHKPHPPHPPHQSFVTHPELERMLNAVKHDIQDVKRNAVTQPQLKESVAVAAQNADNLINGLAGRVGDLEVAVRVLQDDVAALMALIS